MRRSALYIFVIVLVTLISQASNCFGSDPGYKPTDPRAIAPTQPFRSSGPTCAIELTCIDKPVRLGYSDGVCFRATCPGIWALMHKRVDQASFRRRYFAYRHYAFNGTWTLKDSGLIESGPAGYRELFAVLPDDLIQFKLRDPDPNAAVEVTNVGYIKRGSIEDVKKWVDYNAYLERPTTKSIESQVQRNRNSAPQSLGSVYGYAARFVNPLYAIGKRLGIPWF